VKEFTTDAFEAFKNDLQKIITGIITKEGSLPAMGIALLHDKSSDQFEAGFIPVPPKLMQSAETKDVLATAVFPSIFTNMEHGGFKEILAFGFISEVWIRETTQPKLPENYQDLPKKEAVFIQLETKDSGESVIKLIKREGNVVNSDGKLIDNIVLEDHPGFTGTINASTGTTEGRFDSIFRNYYKSKN